ncbi:hypothetical protein [Streptomyces sp. BE147]|uniref:hypothetical protein n=1 Tax=unclassified Streptomyces TaxID=2593676 RepID=UPI002E75B62D|nr:hypothetical protein [Streptomyces sp. BE147]MEE1736848.1 hypothetical protein [Streptomyces sp. BE147]
MLEIDGLLDQIVPAAEAAVVAYGVGVLTTARDETAGATVRLGQRLLARVMNRGANADAVEASVTGLAEAGEDRDVYGLRRMELRIALRDALREHPGLADELSALLPEGPAAQAGGERSVAVAGNSSGIISTGDGAHNTLHR